MYLSSDQVVDYAGEILLKLGDKINIRNADLLYYDDPLEIQKPNKSQLEIRCGGKLVFKKDNNNIITFFRGHWELVLKETYNAIPKILTKRKEEKTRKRRDEFFARRCAKYLGDYQDKNIKVVKNRAYYGSLVDLEVRIYEKRRVAGWLPFKGKPVLVFVWHPRGWIEEPEDNIIYNGNIGSDGSWRQYTENLIKEKKHEEMVWKAEFEAAQEKETERKLNESLERLKAL